MVDEPKDELEASLYHVREAIAVTLLLLLAAFGGGPPDHNDAAVEKFCLDTQPFAATLSTGGGAVATGIDLAALDLAMTQDITALRAAGDDAVATEAQLIQSLVSAQLTGVQFAVGPNEQLRQAGTLLTHLRSDTCWCLPRRIRVGARPCHQRTHRPREPAIQGFHPPPRA